MWNKVADGLRLVGLASVAVGGRAPHLRQPGRAFRPDKCGDHNAAMSELLVAREAGDSGGNLVGSKSFVDLVVVWLGANAPTRH